MCDSVVRKAKQYAFEMLRASVQERDYLGDTIANVAKSVSAAYNLSMVDAERIVIEANAEYNRQYGIMGQVRHG